MDWQVIVLTLGASLITGAVSLIGNIIISKSNIKKSQLENKSEFMHLRIKAYNSILFNLNFLESKIKEKDILEKSNLESKWLNNYHYCSQNFNNLMSSFIRNFEGRDINSELSRMEKIRQQIKFDIDTYYGIKERSTINLNEL